MEGLFFHRNKISIGNDIENEDKCYEFSIKDGVADSKKSNNKEGIPKKRYDILNNSDGRSLMVILIVDDELNSPVEEFPSVEDVQNSRY